MTSAGESWKRQVETHHEQSIRAQGRSDPSDDFWRHYAPGFRQDPRRTDDPLIDRLIDEVTASSTVLDVGGGAGRMALPLALHCRGVTVVEPSESMLAEFRESAREAGIQNATVVQASWEDVTVAPADLVLCAHVVYGVADLVSFARKLESHARERVLIIVFFESPQAWLAPFWRRVHEEERIDLPALPGLIDVLWELEAYPDVEMLPPGGNQSFESRDEAIEQLRRRLYVGPDTAEDRRLHAAVDELMVDSADGLAPRESRPSRQALVSWHPG